MNRKSRKRLTGNMKTFVRQNEEYAIKQCEKPRDKRNLYPQATDAQLVVDVLTDLILGEDWYVTDPLGAGQVNTLILDEILYRYNKDYRTICKKKLHGKPLEDFMNRK